MRILLLFFIAIPLLEMLLLFEVAGHIGGLWTVGLVVLTAVVGIQILKLQGLRTLLRARRRLKTGELPAAEIVEGMLIAAAGAMLLTPGFITDTLGFIFLTPPLRGSIAAWLIGRGIWAARVNRGGGFQVHSKRGRDGAGNVYEGEYSRRTPEADRLEDADER